METAASQFLRALRGSRSQVQLARRLGYRGNPVTDWERGERFPTAEEALRIASLVRVDIVAACTRFSPSVPLERSGAELQLASWLDRLRGSRAVTALAARCGRSRFAISHWLKGTAKPRVPDFFRLLDAITGRLPEWVAEIVPIDEVPALAGRYHAAAAAKRLAFEKPWTEAIVRLLETTAYRRLERHQPGFIGEQLGIDLEEEAECLRRLLAARIVQKTKRKYTVSGQLTVDTQGGRQALHDLKRHWTHVAADRLRSPRSSDLFAYNVMSLSAADLVRVQERLREAFREVRAIVAVSEPAECTALLNLQVITFTEP